MILIERLSLKYGKRYLPLAKQILSSHNSVFTVHSVNPESTGQQDPRWLCRCDQVGFDCQQTVDERHKNHWLTNIPSTNKKNPEGLASVTPLGTWGSWVQALPKTKSQQSQHSERKYVEISERKWVESWIPQVFCCNTRHTSYGVTETSSALKWL